MPEYGVTVHHDLMVEARDGTGLATDVYRPADRETGEAIEEAKPALLYRTPYDKRDRGRVEQQGNWYARHGYVVAIQDVRGRYASDGEFYLLANEPAKRGQSPLRFVPNYEEWIFDFLTTPGDADFWEQSSLDFEAHYREMADVPTVYAGSWYDSYAKATCDNFEALESYKESDQFLLMGAWTPVDRTAGPGRSPVRSISARPCHGTTSRSGSGFSITT